MKPRGPKNRFSVVPWMDTEQLNIVYNHLYSEDLSNKRWAVDQIAVWNTRCHPSLPTSVEATACIVRATVHDMFYQTGQTTCLEEDIKMLYSMALIRFLNLTLEHHQKAVGKMRMSVLAAKHKIPSWLLDLRNEASHSFCPSLTMLRMGAETAMEYLKETFWSKECVRAKLKINLPSERELEIVNLINQYKNLKFLKRNNKEAKTSLNSDMKDVMKKIGSVMWRDGEKFIDTLTQPGNFIAAEDIKQLLMSDESKVSPFIVGDNLVLPMAIQKFWTPLLRKIHMKDLMPLFLEKLLLAQEKCKIKICQKVAIAWALQIFKGVDDTSTLKDNFKNKELLVGLPRLLFACVKGVTPYSKELLVALASRYKRSERDKLGPLFAMISIHHGECNSPSKQKGDPDDKIVFTVEDVEEDINKERAKRMRPNDKVNVWSSPSALMDFSNIPLGAIISPKTSEDDEDMQSFEDSLRDPIKLERSDDDDFIIVNKNDGEGTVEEEITLDSNTFLETFRPENFDMIYRRRPKQ